MRFIRRVLRSRKSRARLWLTLLLVGGVQLGLAAVGPGGEAGVLQEMDDGESASPFALLLRVEGPIGPATTNYLRKSFEVAEERGASLIVMEMDTPGGLVESTRDIVSLILRSPVPVATYVAPSGARAASAGTFILYASHIAAMAPGTTLGAATPVQMGGAPGGAPSPDQDPQEGEEERDPESIADLERKILEDAAAYIRALAELRGRNAEWAERAVREAAALTDREALEEGVIDVQALGVNRLLDAVDGRTVLVGSEQEEVVLVTAGGRVEERLPDWVDQLLGAITNPNVAFVFMMVGIYGLFFELANPGAVVPGVLGAVSLLIGLYALNVLPINHAGLALLLLGVALMVAEAFVPSFGVLGVAGLLSFALGSVMLFDIDDPSFQLSPWTVGSVTFLSGAVLILLVGYLFRAQSRPVATGDPDALVGRKAQVAEWSEGVGRVILDGEWWNAQGPTELAPGETVVVEKVSGLLLTVGPFDVARTSTEEGR